MMNVYRRLGRPPKALDLFDEMAARGAPKRQTHPQTIAVMQFVNAYFENSNIQFIIFYVFFVFGWTNIIFHCDECRYNLFYDLSSKKIQ